MSQCRCLHVAIGLPVRQKCYCGKDNNPDESDWLIDLSEPDQLTQQSQKSHALTGNAALLSLLDSDIKEDTEIAIE